MVPTFRNGCDGDARHRCVGPVRSVKAQAVRRSMSQLRQRVAPRRQLYRLLRRPLPPGYGVAPLVPDPPLPLYEPASFDSFVMRSAWGRIASYPDEWRTSPGLQIAQPARVAVLVHVYFPELLGEIIDQLRHVPVDFDLIVTNSSGRELPISTDITRLRTARILPIENRGRDIWPTVAAVNSGILDPYLVVLKIHTKKSAWRADHVGLSGDGATWRTQLMQAMLGSSANVSEIMNAFREDPSLGVVTAEGSVLGPDFWGDNERNVDELARRLEMDLDHDDLHFAAGSVYWCRGIVLQGLRALALREIDFEPEDGQVNATMAHAVERFIGYVTLEAGLRTVERSAIPSRVGSLSWQAFDGRPLTPRARYIAFYLPQFHPFPENDQWWGTGFTEWSNVAAAKPVYHGHYQPRLPTELGYYDLRVDQTRSAQAELAAAGGIEAFMYYYYWFAGQRLMSSPLESLLRSDLDFPFCIMWANENWTRRWDGSSSSVLIGQDYELVAPETFLDDIAEFLADRRYLTVDGKKVLAVYRPNQMPDFPRVAQRWREIARERGLGELHLLHVDVGTDMQGVRGASLDNGFDGSLAFPPHNHHWSWIDGQSIGMRPGFAGNALSYPRLVEDSIVRAWSELDPDHYPGAMVTFDNTARRPNASDLWYGSNPYTFRRWLAALSTAIGDRDREHRLVFVNAWNEWAEAAVLEPTERYGRSYLLALRDVALS